VRRTQVGTGRIGNFAIRRPCNSDHEPIREFLTGLSPRARYLRFFSGAPPTSGAMLRILVGGSPRTDVLVATTGNGMIIGHAMAGDRAGPGGTLLTEIGVVVADAHRGQGVGSALVRQLVARAQVRGATAVVMEVLAENRQVLTMISDHWPVASQERSGAYITFSARLEPEVAAWPRPGPGAEPRPGPDGGPWPAREPPPAPEPWPAREPWPDPGSWLPGFGKETVAAGIAAGTPR
jgi:GNAT superfamily N-acetyltransferase